MVNIFSYKQALKIQWHYNNARKREKWNEKVQVMIKQWAYMILRSSDEE